MELYKKSTKTRPLLFFESFINNEVLKNYEDMFYNYPINPSQKPFRELGYITYTKDVYEDENFSTVTKYFKEDLEKLLSAELNITKGLLIKRRDKLEYLNYKTDIFFDRQLSTIHTLKVKSESITVNKDLLEKTIENLEDFIKKTSINLYQVPTRLSKIKTNKPYFEPIVNRKILVKLYDVAIGNDLIDEEEVSESDFLNVFMANIPEKTGSTIKFHCDNQTATYFLNAIMVLFYNLKHARIADSKSFFSKGGKLLNQADLDTAKNRYEKKINKEGFLNIQKNIDVITKKIILLLTLHFYLS